MHACLSLAHWHWSAFIVVGVSFERVVVVVGLSFITVVVSNVTPGSIF